MSIIAALQMGSRLSGTQETLSEICSYKSDIKNASPDVVVMPEALLGGYPKGANFGTQVGFRTPQGRTEYRQYWEQAIDINGPETLELAELAKQTQATLVVGAIEREGHSLYCSALFFCPKEGLVARHRKLMPTGSERLIWSMGDGSTMPAIETTVGRIGAAICWENYMPLFRSAMYSKELSVWCAPTVDERGIWQASMRHIAYEARCFVVSACQYVPSPKELGVQIEGWDQNRPLINGGSVIISPMGEILAEPIYGKEGLLIANIDLNQIIEARYDLDVNGHYSRPDIFSLTVDRRAKNNVVSLEDKDDISGNIPSSLKDA